MDCVDAVRHAARTWEQSSRVSLSSECCVIAAPCVSGGALMRVAGSGRTTPCDDRAAAPAGGLGLRGSGLRTIADPNKPRARAWRGVACSLDSSCCESKLRIRRRIRLFQRFRLTVCVFP